MGERLVLSCFYIRSYKKAISLRLESLKTQRTRYYASVTFNVAGDFFDLSTSVKKICETIMRFDDCITKVTVCK